MLAEQRHARILEELTRRRAVTVTELCGEIGASEATIRRDLNELAQQGLLQKVHGGAVLAEGRFEREEPDVNTKRTRQQAEKERIARYAATLVDDDDVVYLDAGTTTMAMAEHLSASRAIFVTNGLNCAQLLMEKGMQVYMLGGRIKANTQAVIGTGALQGLERFNFTKAFMGANGVALRQGFTTPDPEEAAVKNRASEQAYLTYVLADSSKFSKIYAASMFPLRRACIITDHLAEASYREQTIIKEV